MKCSLMVRERDRHVTSQQYTRWNAVQALLFFHLFYSATLFIVMFFICWSNFMRAWNTRHKISSANEMQSVYTKHTWPKMCKPNNIKSEYVAVHGERNGKCAVLKNTKAKVSKPHTVFNASCVWLWVWCFSWNMQNRFNMDLCTHFGWAISF